MMYLGIIKFYRILVTGMLMLCMGTLFAQQTPQDAFIADSTETGDAFKINFFEALSSKAIMKYDKALQALEVCQKLQPENGAVYFEMAKNHWLLKNYDAALDNSNRAMQFIPEEKEWILDLKFQIYEASGDIAQGIAVVEELSSINYNYREFLPELYLKNNETDKALLVIEELDKSLGEDTRRNLLKNYLLQRQSAKNAKPVNLENPSTESEYVQRFNSLKNSREYDELLQLTARFKDKFPNSPMGDLASYTVLIEQEKFEAGFDAARRIFKSEALDQDTKFDVLNELVNYTERNAELEPLLDAVIDNYAKADGQSHVYTLLGDYFMKKQKVKKALVAYLKGLEEEESNFQNLKNAALLSLDLGNNEQVISLTEKALGYYPVQPLFYLLNAVALNNLNQPDKALPQLETALDFIIDDRQLKADVYLQMAESYKLKGDEVQYQNLLLKSEQTRANP
ncbi:MAG: hypothetical protein RQ756_03470 [Flavobacteriaceae bacterium]|nr:hypothetical protein [Flavobacteriaceae bacterium]